MTLLIVLGSCVLYLGPFWYFWRRFTWLCQQDRYNTKGESVVFGALMASVWPITYLWQCATRADGFALAPRDVRQAHKQDALQRRIAELERDLRIAPPPSWWNR